MQRFAESLSHSGWKVKLIGRQKKNSKSLPPSSYQVRRVDTIFKQGVLFYAVLNLIFFCKALVSRSRVLWSVDLDTLPAIRTAAYIRKKTIVWDCHEIFPFMPELYSNPFKQRIWQAIEKRFAPGLTRVLTVTAGVALYLRESYNLSPSIVHNFPDSSPQQPKLEEKLNSHLILFQGALNEGRCLDILIRAMLMVTPSLRLILAGDGPLKQELEMLSQSLGLEERIQFAGELDPSTLKRLTQQARIGVSLLNREHRNSWISLANKNLDYIMAGVPAITVDFPEYVAINSRWQVASLLSRVDEGAVSAAINDLYSDRDRYEKMYTNCLSARKELCWEKEEGKFIQFMNSLEV